MSDSWQDSDFSFGPLEAEVEPYRPTRKRRFVRKVYHKETGAYLGEFGLIFPLLSSIIAIIISGIGVGLFITFEGEDAYFLLFVSGIVSFVFSYIGYIGLSAYISGKSMWSPMSGGSSDLDSDGDVLQGGDLPDGF